MMERSPYDACELRFTRGEVEALLASIIFNDKVDFATLEVARQKLREELERLK